jgi:hypothetical protein
MNSKFGNLAKRASKDTDVRLKSKTQF